MNFFKTKTCWSNLEFIPLKLCIASAYLFIGSYFHDFFDDYYLIVVIVYAITMIWSVSLWINKMRKSKEDKSK